MFIPPRHLYYSTKIGGFWESSEDRRLFSPRSPDDVGIDIVRSSYIDLLEEFMHNPKKAVENNVNSELNHKEATRIIHMSTYLRQAYVLALEHMHDITYTWQRCCEGAIDTLEKMGWKKFGHWRTISN